MEGGEMRKAMPLVAAIVVALATAGVAMAHGNRDATSYADTENKPPFFGWRHWENLENKPSLPGWQHWGTPHGQFCRGFESQINVSEEFKENVMNIAKSDPDVQNLLDAGYENTYIQPIIEATVQGNGDVTIKATGAIITFLKNGGRALVQVDLEAGKVTKIVKVEWTVIEKS
jgi:hypothetical protein